MRKRSTPFLSMATLHHLVSRSYCRANQRNIQNGSDFKPKEITFEPHFMSTSKAIDRKDFDNPSYLSIHIRGYIVTHGSTSNILLPEANHVDMHNIHRVGNCKSAKYPEGNRVKLFD